MIDAKTCINDAQEKMDMAVMYLEEALAHIRAGKASTRLLDGIRVDSYGSMVPISNVAAVTTPDARSIAIKPWDKSMFRIIEKAIMDSDLGITPENNGEIIRLGIPPLTEERRKQLAKQCKGEGETAKVSIRNARRDAIDTLKKAVKEGMPEDEQKNAEAKLQKVHDKYIAKIEELLAEKDKEIVLHSLAFVRAVQFLFLHFSFFILIYERTSNKKHRQLVSCQNRRRTYHRMQDQRKFPFKGYSEYQSHCCRRLCTNHYQQ